MSFTFQDRVSTYPNRYKVTKENGTSEYVTLERADEPTVVGTPLNAATFNTAFTENTRGAEVLNLLDNSDFMNPVNQRGKTIYTAGGYGIDRWSFSGTVTIDNGLSMAWMEQKLTVDMTDGVKRTLAIGTTDGAVYCQALTLGNMGWPLGESGYNGGYWDDSNPNRIIIWRAADYATPLAWVALYEGSYTVDTLPKYKPKPYSAELEECQRYYQIRSTNNVPAVDLRPTMRLANPTITAVDGGYAYSAEL